VPQPLEIDVGYAALPSLSLVISFHDLASSALICEILPLLTLNLRAASAVRLPRERYWAMRRWRHGSDCSHDSKSNRTRAVSAGPACLSSIRISHHAFSSSLSCLRPPH